MRGFAWPPVCPYRLMAINSSRPATSTSEQSVKQTQFGAENGRLVIYFHGAPGAPEECRVFDLEGKNRGLTFVCFDRFSVDSSISQEPYYRLLAEEITKLSQGQPVDVIGFSSGAFIALQVSRLMTNGIRSLHLVSAAAPLEAGDFLEAIAGKQIFQLAKTSPALFYLLSYWQGLLALLFPKALYRGLLVANCQGEDRRLAADSAFQASLIKILRSCFIGRIAGYARDIFAYLQPWKATLCEVTVDTHLWHGSEDNWTPRAMADYLNSAIPGCNSIKMYDGASHYSCLYRAAPEICELLARE